MTRMTEAKSLWLPAVAVAAGFFAAVLPTLNWLQFSNSMENLNVATAMELRRDGGSWLVPTLEGVPRIVKPPLTAWITALAIRPSTVAELDDHDESARERAYESLAIEVRWPALLASSITILATFALGRAIISARVGLLAACVMASNLFFLKFARAATTDIQLTLWVTLANVFIARIIFDGADWKNSLPAALALGLAFMTKGPVAFVQSILPAIVFAIFYRGEKRPNWPALIVGIVVMLFIALSWYAIVARHNPQTITTWLTETNPGGADRAKSDGVLLYLLIIPFMFPWLLFLIDGCLRGVRTIATRKLSREVYATFFLLLSLIIMSCFADRRDRYILPLVPIASIIAAQAIAGTLNRSRRSIPVAIHWIVLIIAALAPLAGTNAHIAKTVDGLPWLSMREAGIGCCIGLAIVAIGWMLSKRVAWSWIATTIALMFALQFVGVIGYSRSREGRSEMLPLAMTIRREVPNALLYNWRPDGKEKRASVDLSIYLNRITKWIADPAALPRTDRPQVYVTIQSPTEPQPAPASGWRFLAKTKRDKDWYVAFVRGSK